MTGAGVATAALGCLLILACSSDPLAAVNQRVLQDEQRLAQTPVRYREDAADGYFRPTGVTLGRLGDERVTWVYSRDHERQLGLVEEAGSWVVRHERSGPRQTVRCHEGLCLGLSQPGGLLDERRGLEPRGYYSGLAVTAGGTFVVDSLRHELVRLTASSATAQALLPGSDDATALPDGRLVVRSWLPPYVYIHDPAGAERRPLAIEAPVRDVAVDVERGVLWTIGPASRKVRRAEGPIEGLYTAIYGYRLADLDRGETTPAYTLDLRRRRLVDGTALAVWRGYVAAVATGSDKLWLVDPDSDRDVVLATGIAPQAVLADGERLWIPTLLDDGVTVVSAEGAGFGVAHVRLATGGEPSTARLGERLFYGKILWDDRPENDFTCNSCHWDTLGDHRLQPGFRESRWELTRPAQGNGMLAPIFTPMQASSLSTAVDGLVRALDHRYWEPGGPDAFLADVRWADGGEPRRATPYEVRSALVSYLMQLGPRRGPLRLPSGGFSEQARRGFETFAADCLSCHEATPDMRSRRRVPKDEILAHLERRPLSFGAPLYARTGVLPYYTRHGNRISPLVALSRGGPYFSNGAAGTLFDVIAMTKPGAALVHAPENAARPHYSAEQTAELVAFLLSI